VADLATTRTHAGFAELAVALTATPGVAERDVHALLRHFDTACTGALRASDLAAALLPPLPQRPAAVTRIAFDVRLLQQQRASQAPSPRSACMYGMFYASTRWLRPSLLTAPP
jgi:hypothetical protein